MDFKAHRGISPFDLDNAAPQSLHGHGNDGIAFVVGSMGVVVFALFLWTPARSLSTQ